MPTRSEIIADTAKALSLPVWVVTEAVSQCKTVEEVNEMTSRMTARISLTEDVNLLASDDTFVVLYHPEKLFYIIERVRLEYDQGVTDQPVIAARLLQGFIITSVHGRGGSQTNVPTDDAARYRMRQYRRQIDD